VADGVSFEAVANLLPEPMLLVSDAGRIAAVNAAFARLTGHTADDLRGTPLATVVRFTPETGTDYLRRCAATRPLVFGAATLQAAGGRAVACRAEGALFELRTETSGPLVLLRLISKEAASSRFVALSQKLQILSDEVQRRQRAEQEADRQRQFLTAANHAKDEFLVTLSHELRTPLNAILGWTRMLQRGDIAPSRQSHALTVIARNAEAQMLLIEDLLDLSRITAGRLQLGSELFPANDPIRAAVDALRPTMDARQLQLTLALHAESRIRGDSRRVQQIVWNLLTNAVKFTPIGGSIAVASRDCAGAVEIVVQDSGQGFQTELTTLIFEPFHQVDASTTRLQPGLGLGLSIARRLVEAHAGTITASSAGSNQGATFTVRLPSASAGATQEAAAPGFFVLPELEGLSILVVDDDEDNRDVMMVMLEQRGARPTGAASAREALARLQDQHPALLIADIGMPYEDGFWLIRQVRALPAVEDRGTPSIAVTAFASTHDRQAALDEGFDDYIPKPVDFDHLVRTIGRIRNQRRSGSSGRAAAAQGDSRS
jgi:signal transduction histidine kinase/CheY-like chemotaxis protein